MLLQDSYWLSKHGEKDSAKKILAEILRIEPGHYEANWLLSKWGKNNKY
jgi:hypothetical protein